MASSPVEAEYERVCVVFSGEGLHYHWIEAEADLRSMRRRFRERGGV